jgi:short-subunit dehydrogenase
LYSELKDTNVKVSVVFPGAVDTNITKNSGLNDSFEAESEQAALKPLPASVAARIIVDGIEKDKYRILVGTDAKMMDLLYRISPKRAAELIAAQMKNLMAN